MIDSEQTPKTTVEEAVTSAYENNICLSLDRETMAFLIGIYVYARRPDSEPTMSASDLKEVFRLINLLTSGEDETFERRSNNAINRLKEQGMIARLDLIGGASYVVTPLGRAVGEHWASIENISERTLIHYATELRLRLEQVLEAANNGGDEQHWQDNVVIPLRETISELVSSLDRRQHTMAAAQKKIQRTISERISADWLSGIEACEKMLGTTGSALEELHSIILRETNSIQEKLGQITDCSLTAHMVDAVEAAETVQGQMEAVRNWADCSFEQWSQYFHRVHDFIRISVRTDPNRHRADRIKRAILFYDQRPWTIAVPDIPCYVHIREESFVQPTEEIEVTGHVNRPLIEPAVPPNKTLLNKVKAETALRLERDGGARLSEIFNDLAPGLSRDEAFSVAGELVSVLASSGRIPINMEREWKSVVGGYDLQEFVVVTTPGGADG